jgi:metal-sulfur cluster biosynthetic enzyme
VRKLIARVFTSAGLFNAARKVVFSQGNVRVRLLLTDPMCLYLFEMRSQIIDVLSALPGVESVEVEPVSGKLWWPERMRPRRANALSAGAEPGSRSWD